MRQDPAAFARLFGNDLGEDWIVPKEPLSHLLVRPLETGAVITGFDRHGNLVAERFVLDSGLITGLLAGLAEAGIAETARDLPESAEGVPQTPGGGTRPETP